jgi:hypothetical protein
VSIKKGGRPRPAALTCVCAYALTLTGVPVQFAALYQAAPGPPTAHAWPPTLSVRQYPPVVAVTTVTFFSRPESMATIDVLFNPTYVPASL